MKKFIAMMMAILMLVACFAGCAKTDGTSDTAGSSNADTTAAVNDATEDQSDTSVAADDTEATGDADKVVVVGYTIYEPMNYFDENNEFVGYDTELAEAVFGNLGYEVIFQEID